MENKLRTLIVKQDLDLTGPRQSYRWQDGIELEVLKAFIGKTSSWETFVYFKADLLIVPTLVMAPWLDSLVRSIPGYVDNVRGNTFGVMDPMELDFSQYDLVITHDPILGPYLQNGLKERFPKTLFAYILAEHTCWQMHQLGLDYDLYLDHTNSMTDEVVRIPQALNFIYPRVPDTLREVIDVKSESVFFDYRSVGQFLKGGNNAGITLEEFEEFKSNIDLDFPIEELSSISLKPFMYASDNKGDSLEYYTKLRRSKYFVTVANRVGQAAFDAASAGALVIGTKLSKLHNMLCDDRCLVKENSTAEDVVELINKIEKENLYEELFKIQDDNLRQITQPMDKLIKAHQLK